MARTKIELNLSGLNELMKSAEMQQILDTAAASIANAAGEGYKVEKAHPIQFIAISSVKVATVKAIKDNNKNNTLLKAVGSVKV